ncbi:S8 family serine peptidase [Pseudoalteromonas sp. ZZD1]|uniref:S8 family serine peptidase n=1 Tax=Pseudoalteromonas sp. ZZD1 TaxID=3139395 RepID=UPI003BA8771C
MKLKAFILSSLLLSSSNLSAAIMKPINGVINQVEPVIEQLKPNIRQPGDDLRKLELIDSAANLSTGLPVRLPIVNKLNEPVFVEVEVEQGFRAVERQWVILAEQHHQAKLAQIGAQIVNHKQYEGLGLSLVSFVVPPSYDSKTKLQALLSLDESALLDRNHIYQAQMRAQQGSLTKPRKPWCEIPVKVGMIDSAVDMEHPGFAAAQIKTQSFLPNQLASPSQHGTAIAGVMVGKHAQLTPRLTQATLYSAAVFYRQSDLSQGATLAAIVDALNWLVSSGVPVINMSFTGPDNAILAAAIDATTAKQVTLVAAAGNEGPAARPLYPAAYKNVIAVSAVNKEGAIYRWANQGDYIDFTALGVSVLTLQAGEGLGRESGTSMAAPHISAAAACLAAKSKATPESIYGQLEQLAKDLGEPGKDAVFGYGLID